jgi:hypothetical protein
MANMGGLTGSLNGVTRALEGSAYVAVGFGVLGFQRAQVRRRELQREVQLRLTGLGSAAQQIEKQVEEGLKPLQSLIGPAARTARDIAAAVPRDAREALAEACAVGARSLRALRVVLEQARPVAN